MLEAFKPTLGERANGVLFKDEDLNWSHHPLKKAIGPTSMWFEPVLRFT